MPAINTISRRTLLSTGASLMATGASFMLLPKGFAAPGSRSEAHPSLGQGGSTATMRCKNAFRSAETAMRCAPKQLRIV